MTHTQKIFDLLIDDTLRKFYESIMLQKNNPTENIKVGGLKKPLNLLLITLDERKEY